MAVNITLTSSMRSNLYALKNLTTQMNTTQMRLATGLKVNTAIDNASSYYQARALNNRASDLDALLDSMGQSIQTITTAIKGLEKSGEMLEQAAVIAEQAYEAAIIPEKAWFEAQVGPNGAVVTTAQELKDAINSGKETICVYGKIDLGSSTITLKNNQKLVGIGYFGDFDSVTEKYSLIEGTIKSTSTYMLTSGNNSLIADLTIKTTSNCRNVAIVYIKGNTRLHNVDVCINNLRTDTTSNSDFIGIANKTSYSAVISGISTIRTENNGHRSMLFRGYYNNSSSNKGFSVDKNSELRLLGGHINIYDTNFNIGENSVVYSAGSTFNACYIAHIQLMGPNSKFIVRSGNITNSTIAMKEGSEFVTSKTYKAKEDFAKTTIYSNNFLSKTEVMENTIDFNYYNRDTTQSASKDSFVLLNKISAQYGTIMTSFDEVMEESSYLGVSLLTGGAMTTIFNEDRDHSFVVQGEDMRSNALGITTREWNTRDDIAASIKEIRNAMGKVRDMVEKLGNNLSIIQTRENFTDKMIDVLQSGADDLVLADMNEESANYLALQTRNNLAVNALSLAAQSGNAVLKLF